MVKPATTVQKKKVIGNEKPNGKKAHHPEVNHRVPSSKSEATGSVIRRKFKVMAPQTKSSSKVVVAPPEDDEDDDVDESYDDGNNDGPDGVGDDEEEEGGEEEKGEDYDSNEDEGEDHETNIEVEGGDDTDGADNEGDEEEDEAGYGAASNGENPAAAGKGNEAKKSDKVLKGKALEAAKPMSQKKLQKFKTAFERTGVVYLSHIPPFLKPPKLRHLLSQYGEVGRVYLKPEDASIRRKRKKMGGNKGKRFTEGWVEFKDKKVAKQVATGLNNSNFGGKKSSIYYDDIWNIKYLKKFKWVHLMERMALAKQTKESRVRAELSQAKKQNDFYRSKVDQAKAIRSMEEKKKRKRESGETDVKPAKRSVVRHFKQRDVVDVNDL